MNTFEYCKSIFRAHKEILNLKCICSALRDHIFTAFCLFQNMERNPLRNYILRLLWILLKRAQSLFYNAASAGSAAASTTTIACTFTSSVLLAPLPFLLLCQSLLFLHSCSSSTIPVLCRFYIYCRRDASLLHRKLKVCQFLLRHACFPQVNYIQTPCEECPIIFAGKCQVERQSFCLERFFVFVEIAFLF